MIDTHSGVVLEYFIIYILISYSGSLIVQL